MPAAGADPPMNPRMSSLVTRPAMPVPWICVMSTLCSLAIFRTSGDDRSRIASSVEPATRVGLQAGPCGRRRPRVGLKAARHSRLSGTTLGTTRCRGRPAAVLRWPRRRLVAIVIVRRRRRRRFGAVGLRRRLRRFDRPRGLDRRFRRGRCGRGGAGGADDGHHAVDRHGLAFLDADLRDHAGGRRRNLGVDLVGRNLEQRLVAIDRVADFLDPADDRALGNRLAHLRHHDISGHINSQC